MSAMQDKSAVYNDEDAAMQPCLDYEAINADATPRATPKFMRKRKAEDDFVPFSASKRYARHLSTCILFHH